jgi:uncharacterized protein YdhG (YjbR/CyaY superfamily)
MTSPQKSAKKITVADKEHEGFSDVERAAIKERAEEVKSSSRRGGKKANEEAAVVAKIAEMEQPDRGLAERFHEIVKASAPDLAPKLWYGMPAYAKDGKVVCFFQSGQKYESRYSSFGFNDPANLDDGNMWPTSFALTKITAAEEKKISTLVKKAAG